MESVELILKIFSVISLTMLKFLAGPFGGYAAGFPWWLTVVVSIAGMMSAVLLFTYVGDYIRDRLFKSVYRRKKVFSKRNRTIIKIWKKFGVAGIAFLTPVLFTPIPGTLILVSFRIPDKIILKNMFISAVIWALIFTTLIYYFGEKFIEYFKEESITIL